MSKIAIELIVPSYCDDCRFFDKVNRHCNLFEKKLKEDSLGRYKHCYECREAERSCYNHHHYVEKCGYWQVED